MNDEFNPNNNRSPDTELEARMVAWVAGEASPFEIAELERVIATRPELAAFKKSMEEARDLAQAALRTDAHPMRLSDERRAELLRTLGVAAKPVTKEVPIVIPVREKRRLRFPVIALAGSFAAVVALFFALNANLDRRIGARKLENTRTDEKVLAVQLPAASSIEAKFAQEDKAQYSDMVSAAANAREQAEMANMRREATTKQKATGGPVSAETPMYSEPNAVAINPEPVEMPSPTDVAPTTVVDAPAINNIPAGAGLETRGYAKFPPPKEADVKLSPFEVTVSNLPPADGQEYGSQQTLAGTRMQTDSRDVGSSVSVVTNQFLKDTRASTSWGVVPSSNLTKKATGGVFANGQSSGTIGGFAGKNGIGSVQLAPANSVNYAPLRFDPQLLDDDSVKITHPKSAEPVDRSETETAKNPVSTFSLHVSDVSFRLAAAALARSEAIDPLTIRPEEFTNAFDYGDPAPAMTEKVACRIEQSAHPFAQGRNLVRIAVRVPATGRDAAQPLRLTVLLDTSGSMEREDRAATARAAMKSLVSLLGPNDRLTLVGFARQPRLLAEDVAGNETAKVLEIAAHTPSEGGTNLEEALKLAGDLATRHFTAGAQNRVVMLTDGAANLGDADPAGLAGAVAALRTRGLAFDACGVGLDGLDDTVLERLTRQGGGRYYVLNSPDEADAGFARQLAGAFRPAAENVKLQVRFNPARVASYRLIGFEQHRLREQDFRDDSVAAAPLAAEEAAIAIYQVQPLPEGDGELGEVYVRFHDTATDAMVERSWTLPFDAHATAFDRATPSMQLAGLATLVAEKLQGGPVAEAIRLEDLAPAASRLRAEFPNQPRVQQLVEMFQQMRRDDRR